MNANLCTKKIEMTKKEAKAAGKIGSDEFKNLRQLMEMYPGYEIQIKTPAKRKAEFRGLDYKYMKEYIEKHADDDGKIMAEFRKLTAQDKKDKVAGCENQEAANYASVKKWFLKKFPEIKEYKEKSQKEIRDILAAA